jgi:putative inorganic carbon (hco3(-)) transporter
MGFFLFVTYLAAFFLRPTDLIPALARFQLMDVMAFVALGGAVFGLLAGRRPSLATSQPYLVVAFLAWASLTVVLSIGWLRGAIHAFTFLGINLFLFLLAILNVDSLRRLKITSVCLAFVAVVLALQGILAVHAGLFRHQFILSRQIAPAEGELEIDPEYAEADSGADWAPEGRGLRIRGLGMLNDPNDLGQALVALLPFVFALRRRERGGANLLLVWIPSMLIVYGIFLTRSRGALLALVAVVGWIVASRLGGLFSTAVGAVMVTGFLLVGHTGGSSLDESAADRIYAWYAGIHMVRDSPIWGVGFGNFGEHHALFAHNSFLHCAAEVGLVGYFLWLSVLVVTVVDSWSLERTLDPDDSFDAEVSKWLRTTRRALFGFLAAGFFLSRAYSFLLFVLVGLSTATVELARREGRPPVKRHLLGWVAGIAILEVVSLGVIWFAVRVGT